MDLFENVSDNLKLTELKKNTVRKSILCLMLEWKDLDEHLDLTQNYLEERLNEIESREKRLFSIQKSISESNKELLMIRSSIEGKVKEFELKEKELQLFEEEHINYFNLKEKDLYLIAKSVEESIKEVEFRESKLGVQKKLIEGIFEKVELETKEFESLRKSVGEKLEEIHLKEERIGDRSKELDSIQNWIERRAKELDAKEEKVESLLKEIVWKENQLESVQIFTEERCKELEIKEKQLDSVRELNDQRSEELDSRERQLESVKKFQKSYFEEYKSKKKELQTEKKLFEERCKEIEIKEKQLDSVRKSNEQRSEELDSRERQLESVKKFHRSYFEEYRSKKKELQLENKLFEERCKKLESKEKELENWSRGLEFKEKRSLNVHIKSESLEDTSDNLINGSSPDIQMWITMNGKALQSFLNERAEEHKSMSDEIFKALQLSLDPAKLVLDAMEGFYPPHLKKGDVEFEGNVVRKSCILLLEQLMRLSPQIRPRVKEDALKLAGEWKEKMSEITKNLLEVFGFLYLLASYGLARDFEVDEILNLFEIVSQYRQAPDLCHRLGFTVYIPDFVGSLIKKKDYLMAVRFVCKFGLVEKFPLAALLEDHLKYLNLVWTNTSETRSLDTKNEDIDNRVDALRDVIKCIVDNKLEAEYSPKLIESKIEDLVKQKEEYKQSNISSTNEYIPTKALTMALTPPKAIHRFPSPAAAMGVILANFDGKTLQFFLNEHFEDQESLRNEVLVALQVSYEPAKLVLDAVQGFYPPHIKVGNKDFEACVIRSSCILLLEELMRLSPYMKTSVKEAAADCAVNWKDKMGVESENHLEMLGFLNLVGAYGLASAFNADELRNLLRKIAQHRHVHELCQALGFSENISSSGIDHSHSNNTVASSCTSFGTNTDGQVEVNNKLMVSEIPAFIHNVSDPAKVVLDALRLKGYPLNWQKNKNSKVDTMWKCTKMNKNIMKSFIFLFEQLRKFSAEIKPCVKEAATKFAVDWEAKRTNLHTLEIIGYLQFLATYNLASVVNEDELIRLLLIVHGHKGAADLSRVLGLANKLPRSDLVKQINRQKANQRVGLPSSPSSAQSAPAPVLISQTKQQGPAPAPAPASAPAPGCVPTPIPTNTPTPVLMCQTKQQGPKNLSAPAPTPAPVLGKQTNQRGPKKRPDLMPAPTHTLVHPPNDQQAQKRARLVAPAEAAPSAPQPTGYLPQHRRRTDKLTEQSGPYLRATYAHCSMGFSVPPLIHPPVSHIGWQHWPDPVTSGGTTMPFRFTNQYGAHLNPRPPTLVGLPYLYWPQH